MVTILLASHRAVLAAHGIEESTLPVEEMARNGAQIIDLEQQFPELPGSIPSDDLRDRLSDLCGDAASRAGFFIVLNKIVGDSAEDALWFADMLATRSSDHASQIYNAVNRLVAEAQETRAHRRIEQHLAALGAEHRPVEGWEKHVLAQSRAYDRCEQAPQPSASIWRRMIEWLRRS